MLREFFYGEEITGEPFGMISGQERDVDNTMEPMRKLHSMEGETREELEMPPEKKIDLEKKIKNYGHIRRDHVRKVGDSIEETNRNGGLDLALFQEDMILTEFVDLDVSDCTATSCGGPSEDVEENAGHRTKRQAFRDKNYPNTTWPKGVNYYLYNASLSCTVFSPLQSHKEVTVHLFTTSGGVTVRLFRKAAALWSAETCVNFGETYAGKRRNFELKMQSSLMKAWESQRMRSRTLGFFHTQSKHDRDNFARIDFSNIQTLLIGETLLQYGWEGQFTKQTKETNYSYNMSYDYGTLMHYGAMGFVNFQLFHYKINLQKSLGRNAKTVDSPSQKLQQMHLTQRIRVRLLRPKIQKKCRTIFQLPGYGKTVTATESYQTISNTVGRWDYHPEGDTDEYYMCTYWIQVQHFVYNLTEPWSTDSEFLKGMPGSKIQVVFVNYTENLSLDGCIYVGVEIKTLADKRRTGYRQECTVQKHIVIALILLFGLFWNNFNLTAQHSPYNYFQQRPAL
ncbi:unnamed protein product [Angiostrongylus costaricensis]|uniref:Astacin domain-containing protein n=1 Tax=Angiostrongylus costaricensis TaxID=334426 RepID=A0A158PID9_ANGCS|nr:unnamed protein product [Angiostrongylus costaricensis]